MLFLSVFPWCQPESSWTDKNGHLLSRYFGHIPSCGSESPIIGTQTSRNCVLIVRYFGAATSIKFPAKFQKRRANYWREISHEWPEMAGNLAKFPVLPKLFLKISFKFSKKKKRRTNFQKFRTNYYYWQWIFQDFSTSFQAFPWRSKKAPRTQLAPPGFEAKQAIFAAGIPLKKRFAAFHTFFSCFFLSFVFSPVFFSGGSCVHDADCACIPASRMRCRKWVERETGPDAVLLTPFSVACFTGHDVCSFFRFFYVLRAGLFWHLAKAA